MIKLDKENFKKAYLEKFQECHGKNLSEGTDIDKFTTFGALIRDLMTSPWIKTNNFYLEKQKNKFIIFQLSFY
ncbi:starch phosphorylase [Desulfonispora thiosulfatigenes DSM 11270]|uniref:Starch phosphorylase n=1 Tax=Desulfonispora thiosulfatigenes DSM 11270 TaxID=656914 RepID=A0A1W1VLN8_DESTI|nr:starch phosphorylase [Desulfonispora thiosulfatigenes DSM 11270]